MKGSALFRGICSRARSPTRIDEMRRVSMIRCTALAPKPGHAQQVFAAGAVDVEREALAVAQRPGELRIHVQRQHAVIVIDDLVGVEAVEAHQPVGLIQPMLADQRRGAQRQRTAGIGDRAEGGVIDTLEIVGPVRDWPRCG